MQQHVSVPGHLFAARCIYTLPCWHVCCINKQASRRCLLCLLRQQARLSDTAALLIKGIHKLAHELSSSWVACVQLQCPLDYDHSMSHDQLAS